jgi:hypothetical protein
MAQASLAPEPVCIERFHRLAAQWKAQRGPTSSITELVMHPAYQQIIGLGPAAVPWLLAELEHDPDHWFWALKSITMVDPVLAADRGNLFKMAEAWLKWGSEQGYRW